MHETQARRMIVGICRFIPVIFFKSCIYQTEKKRRTREDVVVWRDRLQVVSSSDPPYATLGPADVGLRHRMT